MRRACIVTLKFATAAKRNEINLLVKAYRGCVNRFIKVLWQMPSQEFGLDKETLALVPGGRLSARYKSQALKQAIEIVESTRRARQASGQKAGCPKFTGCAVLDAKFVSVEDKHTRPGNPFDLVVRLSTLKKGARIIIPTCRTKPLNKWLSRPGARLIQGCALSEDSLTLWVEEADSELPFALSEDAVVYGADLGMAKLLTLNDGTRTAYLGRHYHALQNRIARAKPGSKARARLFTERDHLVGRVLNAIPWRHVDALGVEDLTGISRGKGTLGKEFRRKRSPWAHRKVLERAEAKAQENRVLLVAVLPRNTSRECPACRRVSALNRKGELFRCVACGHIEDADSVGSGNIRSRTLTILDQRRAWLNSHPFSLNRAHFATRRSLASRRAKKVIR
jgi:Putative transposase DNA-binding domain